MISAGDLPGPLSTDWGGGGASHPTPSHPAVAQAHTAMLLPREGKEAFFQWKKWLAPSTIASPSLLNTCTVMEKGCPS